MNTTTPYLSSQALLGPAQVPELALPLARSVAATLNPPSHNTLKNLSQQVIISTQPPHPLPPFFSTVTPSRYGPPRLFFMPTIIIISLLLSLTRLVPLSTTFTV